VDFPRINVYLNKLTHNAKIISGRFASRGITAVAVTKSVLGDTRIARSIGHSGIENFGDSRLKNLIRLAGQYRHSQLILLRSPMESEIETMVGVCATSLNTQIETVEKIDKECAAQNRSHNIIVMVETDDSREGLLPGQVLPFIKKASFLDNIHILGLGTNARCISKKKPSYGSLSLLPRLQREAEKVTGRKIPVLSGGNSSLYTLLLEGKIPAEINQVRIGEAIMLGHETLNYLPISGTYGSCFLLEGQIIEVKAGGKKAILALGSQDGSASNLLAEEGVEVLGQSSDHTVVGSKNQKRFCIGDIISFKMDYIGLLSAMTSPFVKKNYIAGIV